MRRCTYPLFRCREFPESDFGLATPQHNHDLFSCWPDSGMPCFRPAPPDAYQQKHGLVFPSQTLNPKHGHVFPPRPDSAFTQDSPRGVLGNAGPTAMGDMHHDTPITTPTRSPGTNSPASHRSRTESSPNGGEGEDRSPQPRFWGQGDRVEKLTLDNLR